jgi:hypothetical protein
MMNQLQPATTKINECFAFSRLPEPQTVISDGGGRNSTDPIRHIFGDISTLAILIARGTMGLRFSEEW